LITDLNVTFLSILTSFVARCTRDNFRKNIEEKERNNHILEKETPFTDNMGRSTYFYVKLGALEVPVYQAGSPGFYSSFKEDTPLSIMRDEHLVNGTIVGNGCSDYIQKCIWTLANTYKQKTEAEGLKNDSHKNAWVDTITNLSEENACHCGRFAEYVPFVWNMISDADITNLMGSEQKLFDTKDLSQILIKRRTHLAFDTVGQFFEVGHNPGSITLVSCQFLDKYRDAVIDKNLLSEEQVTEFRALCEKVCDNVASFSMKSKSLPLGTAKPDYIEVETAVNEINAKSPFEQLDMNSKMYAYYITRAAWSGSKINFFQRSYESPALGYLFMKIFMGESMESLKEKFLQIEGADD